ncbi:MAG: hypothetical protein KDC75_01665 [Phaeodactylibacter sp.]|nr:hypothetical protein [Phaeodactylibacter sp.]
MKNHLMMLSIVGSSVIASCQQDTNPQLADAEVWRLGWRMIASSMDENFELAELQFDSLLNLTDEIDRKFLITGLEAKAKLDKKEEVVEILNAQDEEMLREVCLRQLLGKMKPCHGFTEEKVENKALQMELIRMYVDDQAARGNIMEDIVSKYNIDTTQITKNGAVGIDERNRNRLKEIFAAYGFPTRKLVGKDAMYGIFLMIQHADGDKEWQRSQLTHIEEAVKNGDLDGQSYAYLYDRIKVNSGEQQLYGTQFAKVDPINKIVELAETADVENLNARRRELGLMPIEMYKRYMLKVL